MVCRNRSVLPALVAAFAAAAVHAPAQEPPKPAPQPAPPSAPAAPASEETKGTAAKSGFESLAPSGALLYAGVDSVDQVRADWAASPWGRLLADPSNEPLRKAFAHLVAELGTTTEKETGVDLVAAFDRVSGRLGLGIYGEIEGKGNDFGFTLGAEAGEHIAELRALTQKLFEHGGEKAGLVLKSEKEGDVEVTVAVAKEPDSGTPDLRVGAAGPVLVVDGAAGRYREHPNFQNALAAVRGEGKESLAAVPAFKESRAARPGGIKFWFDTGAVARAAFSAKRAAAKDEKGDDLDYDLMFATVLGLEELGPVSARMEVNAKEMRVEALQAWSGKGLLVQLLSAWLSGSDSTLLQLVPADVEMAAAAHVDFTKGMEVSKALQKAIFSALGQPDDEAAGAPDPNAPPDADAPLDPKRDFMDHLDGRIALFLADVDESERLPLPGMTKPRGFCLVLGVKGAAPLRASLDKLLRSQGLHAARKKSEFQGFEVYSIPITPLSAHYAILDDLAVISSSQTLLQDVLRRKSDKELKNLAGDAGFKRNFDALSPGSSLILWSRADPNLYSSMSSGLSGHGEGEEAEAIATLFDDENGEKGKESAATTLQHELGAVLKALGTVDPAVAAKHLPPGSILGLGASPSGLHLEGVSR